MSRTIRIVSGAKEGNAFDIEDGQELRLGRSPNNDVVLTYDSCASGNHALLTAGGGRVYLKDLNSTNGSFLQGEKMLASVSREVDEFFVLGSTILKLTEDSEPCPFLPLPRSSPEAHKWDELPVFRAVLNGYRQEPLIHSAHLFSALLGEYWKELSAFFDHLRYPIDIAKLSSGVKSCKIFKDSLSWLNKPLSLRAGLAKNAEVYITPRVQSLLDSVNMNIEFRPMHLLSEFLSQDFNLAFPLLDWEKTRPQWNINLQKMRRVDSGKLESIGNATLSQKQYGMESLGLFWDRLEKAHRSKQLLVVTGSRGCGKTTALHLGFENRPRPFLSQSFYKGARTFLDPKAFLFFNHPSKLSGYAWRAAALIRRNEFVVIDHFGEMLLAMQHENIDRNDLLQALHQHQGPVLLCTGKENMELVEIQLGFVETLDMDRYLEPNLSGIYEKFLRGYEKRIDMKLNARARRFFLEKVAAVEPYNFGALKEFLILCAGRTGAIDPSFSEQTTITRSVNELGEACLRDVYDEWMRKPQTSGSGAGEIQVLKQIEELFHQYAKHLFNVHLRYSDQTRHFDDPGRLGRQQKLEELKSHLVTMFSSFQSSFPAWFQDFWMKLDPEIIRVESGGANHAKKLWQAYCDRTKTIDSDYAEDRFNETAARVFLEALRTRGSQGGPLGHRSPGRRNN